MSISLDHEALVMLLRDHPDLAVTLARPALGAAVPSGTFRVADASLTQVAPAALTADLVVLLGEPPALGLVVEVQLGDDPDKAYTWPHYAIALRSRWRCPTAVVVIAPEARIARRARRPIVLGPGNAFRPIVVGPEAIPRVDVAAARDAPALAVISALAHGRSADGHEAIATACLAMAALPVEAARIYNDVLAKRFPRAYLRAMEVAMPKGGYEYQSDFARKYYGEGLAAGTRKVVLKMLAIQCGLPGPELHARIGELDNAGLEALGEALLEFKSLADLEAWLADRAR